ncbi:MAG: Hsp20 family protein, partial [Gammaproteobacteria bacterium]|nr:Hsp20 family protein [Gammaproteobacteria bacterium]
MTTIDLTPLYRSTIGFDRFGSLLNAALGAEKSASAGYPPYNIEVVADDHYDITVAVAGFEEDDLDIQVENSVLTISGKQKGPES